MATVTIPDDLHDRIDDHRDPESFDSVDEYATFALSEILDQFEGRADATAGDQDEVMDKLRDLGYLE
ncbi:CopG family transcriptional regulator [Halapricum desulfuricans]|uniref:Transcriptional regulator, CopG/Arc/MetJ family (DNA-binding and a metal-binding domains) n=1 Tax=Halapricum desulfuricans TaxID=2841257 RepID=A0A897N718_9EURY|nr:CopG family transcriptional regulator [Halapricum desulfuricans]QSG08241.1 Transcriptional regulator, CopG/Arc/MetJ family (DNA-binding and a metal-binding domains) [Halapricum desulfuricans]